MVVILKYLNYNYVDADLELEKIESTTNAEILLEPDNKNKANNSKRKKFLHSTVTTLIYRITIQDHKLLIALHSIHQVHVVTF